MRVRVQNEKCNERCQTRNLNTMSITSNNNGNDNDWNKSEATTPWETSSLDLWDTPFILRADIAFLEYKALPCLNSTTRKDCR